MNKRSGLYLEVLLVGVFWGTSFVAISIALRYLNPVDYLSVRWMIAAVLAILLIAVGVFKVNYRNKPIWALAILVLIQPGGYSLMESMGIKYTSASEASIMLALVPIVTAFIVTAVFKEKVKKSTIIAAFICFTGVILTVAFEPDFQIDGKMIGYLYLITCVILAGFFTVISNKLAVKFTPTEVVVAMTVGGAICFNLLAIANGSLIQGYVAAFSDWKALAALTYLAVFCAILCFKMYNHITGNLNPAQTSLFISNSVTLIGVISGVLITGDSMSVYKGVGVALIIFGVVKHGLDEKKEEDKINEQERQIQKETSY